MSLCMIACQVCAKHLSVGSRFMSCCPYVFLTKFFFLPELPMMSYQMDNEDTYENCVLQD